MQTIAIASDHAGFELKQQLIAWLSAMGYKLSDMGTNSSESVDYPDYAHKLALAVQNNEASTGIALCGSGNGVNMTVNKHQCIRGALCWNAEIARLARFHNDANVCSLPARFISFEQAKEIVMTFLDTGFEGGRHIARVGKISVKNCQK
ncbi:MAG: ribose 5-phosphate isomerase B [Bacteroidia bacterium]|nr:ribose 5-phosphate isomerase B [Bacteroidia bacterium]